MSREMQTPELGDLVHARIMAREREPEKAHGNLAAIRENIAHKERARKIRDIGLEKLQAIWDGQITSLEKESLRHITSGQPVISDASENVAEKAVAWSEEH